MAIGNRKAEPVRAPSGPGRRCIHPHMTAAPVTQAKTSRAFSAVRSSADSAPPGLITSARASAAAGRDIAAAARATVPLEPAGSGGGIDRARRPWAIAEPDARNRVAL